MAPMVEVLQWKDTGSSGRKGRGSEEGVTLCVSDQLQCMELCLGWMRSQQTSYGSGLKGGKVQMML